MIKLIDEPNRSYLPLRRGSLPGPVRPSSPHAVADSGDGFLFGRNLSYASPPMMLQLDLAAHTSGSPPTAGNTSRSNTPTGLEAPKVRPMRISAQGPRPTPAVFDEHLYRILRRVSSATVDYPSFAPGNDPLTVLLDENDEFCIVPQTPLRDGRRSAVMLGIRGSLTHELLSLECVKRHSLDNHHDYFLRTSDSEPPPLALVQNNIWADQIFSLAMGAPFAARDLLYTSDLTGDARACYITMPLAYNDVDSALAAFERRIYKTTSTQIRVSLMRKRHQVGLWMMGTLLGKLNVCHVQHHGGLRDIKCTNMLLDDQLTPYLDDNEFAALHGQPYTGGSLQYLPPQLLYSRRSRNNLSAESDAWAMGQVLVQLMLGSQRFVVEMRPHYGHLEQARNDTESYWRRLRRLLVPEGGLNNKRAIAFREEVWRAPVLQSISHYRGMSAPDCREALLRDWHQLRRELDYHLALCEKHVEAEGPDHLGRFESRDDTTSSGFREVSQRIGHELYRVYTKLLHWRQAEDDVADAANRLENFFDKKQWTQQVARTWSDYRTQLLWWADQEEQRTMAGAPGHIKPLPALAHGHLQGQLDMYCIERLARIDSDYGWGPRLIRTLCLLMTPEPEGGGIGLAFEALSELFDGFAAAILQQTTLIAAPTAAEVAHLQERRDILLERWRQFIDEARILALNPRHKRTQRREEGLLAVAAELPQHWVDRVMQLITLDDQFHGEGLLFAQALKKLDPDEIGVPATFEALARLDDEAVHPAAQPMTYALRAEVLGPPGKLYQAAGNLVNQGLPLPHEAILRAFAPPSVQSRSRQQLVGLPTKLFNGFAAAILHQTTRSAAPAPAQMAKLKDNRDALLQRWRAFLDDARVLARNPRRDRPKLREEGLLAMASELPQHWVDRVLQLVTLDDQFHGNGLLFAQAIKKLDPEELGAAAAFDALAHLDN